MVFRKTMARELVLAMVLAGCGGQGTGPTLIPDSPVDEAGLSALNDEFDDPSSISTWLVRSQFESDPSDGSVESP